MRPQRGGPLRLVLVVAETMADVGNQVIGEATEGGCGLPASLCGALLDQRVLPVGNQPPGFRSLPPRIGEGHGRQPAEAHLLELAIPPEEEDPPPRGSRPHHQIDAPAISMPARFRKRGDLAR